MDCMKSFTLSTEANDPVNTPTLVSWGIANENYWNIDNVSTVTSQFNVEGFKNINIHGVDMVGFVTTSTLDNKGALIHDWGFTLTINGTVPLIGGNSSTSLPYNLTTGNKTFALTKYKTNISFSDPITSVKNLTVLGLYANGSNLQNLTSIRLSWFVSFVFYYTFEGEDEKFAFL